VDVIFPSLDPEVYLFAKNKRRLANKGILAVVPDPEVIRIPMDKALTIRVAQRVGFPAPRTWFADCAADVERIPGESAAPWLVKPRFTAHGAHMVYVEDAAGLVAAYAQVSGFQPSPFIQEFIPGGLRQNFYLTVGRDGKILSLLSPRVTRTYAAGYRVACKTCVSASTGPYLAELRALIRELGLWGGYTIQTKIDPRDGLPKLLEINPRMGQHLWWRTELGVNEPQICLRLARGETLVRDFQFPDGVVMLDPYHDLFFLYDRLAEAIFRTINRLLRRGRDKPGETANANGPGVLATLRLYKRDYLNRSRKILCPEVHNLLVDPYPCLRAFWFKFRGMTGNYLRRAMRAR
jgi:predicted ATP-grasp superfamily ATP-dependent carboligase